MEPKVLVATAIGPGKDYCAAFLPATLATLTGSAASWLGLDGATLQVAVPTNTDVAALPPWEGDPETFRFARIARMREAARRYCLAGEWTHLFFLDADVVPPTDTIPRLLAHGAPVACGIYFVRDHVPPLVAVDGVLAEMANAGRLQSDLVWTAPAAAMGCMLIERSILERTPFRDRAAFILQPEPGEDYCWCYDAGRAVRVDARIRCWHVGGSGRASRLTASDQAVTAMWLGPGETLRTQHGEWQKNVPRADLSTEEMAKLGPGFNVGRSWAIGVEFRQVGALFPRGEALRGADADRHRSRT